MEHIRHAARRALEECERAMKARKAAGRLEGPAEIDAGRVEQSERSNVFPDATERRPASDADSICGDFTTPGRLCGGPGNARQGLVIRENAKPQALGREGLIPRRLSRPSGAQVAANDNIKHHAALCV